MSQGLSWLICFRLRFYRMVRFLPKKGIFTKYNDLTFHWFTAHAVVKGIGCVQL